ncbi:DUF1190 domain-containing protein [Dryocola sp. BD626]|uniref:DUF1190 domain-containing protein n=1 Tax=Dryocola sp. BD626 TaxID=3133273 RepID=UPI003F4F52B2
MSRKKSSRNKSVSPFLSKTPHERKGPRVLTLMIMGGAALFILKGCDDDEASETSETIYSTPYECSADSHLFETCNAAFEEAKKDFYSKAPKNLNRTDCELQFGDGSCHYETDYNGYIPAFAGFILGQALANSQRSDCRHNSDYCSNYTSRPVWAGSSGHYSYSSSTASSGQSYSSNRHSTRVTKATTVSRGGYGKSSSARGSWGG